MKTRLTMVGLGLLAWLVGTLAVAATAADVVGVGDPYVRAMPPGQRNSASFMTLENSSARPHELVAAASPVARIVELHEHTHQDGMMMMRQVPVIEIPAGGKAVLQPGGLHVMLIGLTQDLKPGTSVPLTLEFADGSKKTIQAPVRKLMMKMKGPMH